MSGTDGKITPFQFYNILFLSRIFASVTYIASIREKLSTTDFTIMILFMFAFLLITSLPVFWFIKKDNSSSILVRASCISGVFSKIIAVLYLAEFIVFGVISSARFEILSTSVMFPEKDVTFFLILVLAFAVYASIKGIEAIGRAGTIFLLLVVISFLFVLVSLLKKFEILNFTPIFDNGAGVVAESGLYSCARTGEIMFIPLFLPYIRNHKPKHMYAWIAVTSLIIFGVAVFESGVLGEFGNTQLFAMYSLSVLAEMGFVQRIDSIITCFWILCAAAKLSFVFFGCSKIMESLFGKPHNTLYPIISAIPVLVGTMLLSGSIRVFADAVTPKLIIPSYGVAVCIIPLAVILGEKIKKAGKHEKTS